MRGRRVGREGLAELIAIPALSDGTFAVRPWRETDIDIAQAMLADPLIPRYTSIAADQTRDRTAAWVAKHAELAEADSAYYVAIADAMTDAFLGSSGIERSADDPAIGEIGYWLGASARGRGAARSAVRLLVDWGFETMGLARLEITAHPDNEASQRVALACGFQREGVLRSWRPHGDGRDDLVMFSLLPSDPR